ncbi:MAG: acetyl-CoA carboxylase carboxyltransferase subunit alpha [Syntrophaceticus sp.]
MEFEKDYQELEKKLNELKEFAQNKQIDFSHEIATLEAKLESYKEEKYNNLSAWQKVQIARHPERPTTMEYIEALFDDFIELHGDRCYRDDPAIVGGIARYNGTPITVIGHQKGRDTNQNLKRNFGMPHPEGYRKACRLAKQAEKFRRPVICFIDTQGAYPGVEAEERGQGWAIAQRLMQMSILKTPIISLVIGEGGSGGALALGVADRVLMLSYAIYSVISPEGCASILCKDVSRSHEMAEYLKLTAQDLYSMGVIDEIIPEPLEGAHTNLDKTHKIVKEKLQINFDDLLSHSIDELLEKRYERLRNIGIFEEDEEDKDRFGE